MATEPTGARATSAAHPPAGSPPASDTAAPVGRSARRQPIGEYIFAGLALALGIFVFVGAFSIRLPTAGTQVGPRVFPFLVAGILIVSAVGVLVGIIRGKLAEEEAGEDIDATASTDWLTLAKIVGFLGVHAALIGIIGWPFAAAILFGGVAWSLGAAKWWKALLVGLVIGFVVYISFAGFLGLSLPSGPLLGWLDPFLRSIGI